MTEPRIKGVFSNSGTTPSDLFRHPFAEQADFFRRKLNLPSAHWDDILKDEHDRAFIVAGAMKADLVADLRVSVQQAIDNGKSIGWFRQQFDTIVKKHGWTGWTGENSPAGVAWRTRVIYTTNLRTSYAAGRWAQLTDPDTIQSRPFWRFVHRSVAHPRAEHVAWNGTVLPAADPWFSTHYPPCGFGCECIIEALNDRDLKRLGKSGPDKAPDNGTYTYIDRNGEPHVLPTGVDYGWDYAPGKSATENALSTQTSKLENLDTAVGVLNVAELVKSDIFAQFFSGHIKGEFPIAILNQADQTVLDAQSPVVLLSQESLAAHAAKHPEITLADYRKIQSIIDQGDVYKQGDARLIYITLGDVTYRAALKRTADGKKNYFLTLFKNEKGKPPLGAIRVR
jgi:hypothetical protein